MKGKIFNAQEVQAIIAENKTMFREVIKPCKQHPKSLCKKTRRAHYGIDFTENGLFWRPYGGSGLQPYPYVDSKLSNTVSLDDYCPYQVGQKIFVKESFVEHDNKILFKTSHQKLTTHFLGSIKWRPAQRMKQEHSRLTLEITDVKVERLGEISEEDAFKEGAERTDEWTGCAEDLNFTDAFKFNWNATHKKPEEKFEANPFCWVVDFKINK